MPSPANPSLYVLSVGAIVTPDDSFPADMKWVGRIVSHAIVANAVHYIVEVAPIEMERFNLHTHLQIIHSDNVMCVG